MQAIAKRERMGFETLTKPVEYHASEQQRWLFLSRTELLRAILDVFLRHHAYGNHPLIKRYIKVKLTYT